MGARLVSLFGIVAFGCATLASAQQPASDAASGSSPIGTPASGATGSTATQAPPTDRILWDQLDPKYRRATSERQLMNPGKQKAAERPTPPAEKPVAVPIK